MAYKTEDLIKKALIAIEAGELVFMDEVIALLPCSNKTFHNHKLHELQDIKDALELNRINIKQGLRNKWYKSDNATVQIALYKLIGSEDEYAKLATIKQDISNKDPVKIVFENVSKDYDIDKEGKPAKK